MCRLFLFTFLFAAGICSAAIPDPVKTDSGLLSGVAGKNPEVRVYKGIPFAAPPVGDLRWKAPQPVAHWSGVRAADAFGPQCMQGGAGGGRGGRGGRGGAKGGPPPAAAQAGPAMSEDCLYLNVWTAANSANDKRPVIVWSHPGGYTSGSGSSPQFDGEALAKKGVILVTHNYRLGVFGFFSLPELSKESGHGSGNYALMDLAETLRWVQKNIAAFGGDPKRVTIAGDSAGAAMVAMLTGSPQGKGLFQRVISESGAWMGLGVSKMTTLAQGEQQGERLEQNLGAKSLAELRAKSAQEMMAGGGRGGPVVDGWFIPEDLTNTFEHGKQNKVDILVGSNRDEGTFFTQPGTMPDAFVNQAKQRYGDLADAYLKLYPAGSAEEVFHSQLASFRDALGFHQRKWAQLQEEQGGNKVYVYYFTHDPTPGPNSRGATHGAEAPYVFQNPGRANWTELDKSLSDTISSYWVNFAATGNPNGKGLPNWPEFRNKRSGPRMVLGDKIEPEASPDKERLAWWDSYYKSLSRR